jgi:hypothetical protein
VSARTTTLDERYGRTGSRRRRSRVTAIVAAAVVLVAVAVWSVWTGVGGSADALDTQTVTAQVRSAEETDVAWLVSGRPDTKLVCAIQAQTTDGVVVGLVEVVVPVTGQANRHGSTVVHTVRRADTGLIASCRDA